MSRSSLPYSLVAFDGGDNSESDDDRDRLDEILDAFVADFPSEDASQAELDELYSNTLASGTLSEGDITNSFESFLNRQVTLDPKSGELTLTPQKVLSIGEFLQAYLEHSGMRSDALSRRFGLTEESLRALKDATDPYDPERLAQIVDKLASDLSLSSPSNIRRLLQHIRVTFGISLSNEQLLMAARKKQS